MWNQSRIEEGRSLLRVCLARDRPGPYQLQAAINAVHSDSRAAAHSDWPQILTLYDQLMAIAPSPVVALNRAVAVAEIEGVDHALRLVDAIALPKYHLFHAVRADLLRRLGRDADAATEYQIAIEQCENGIERDLLTQQCRSLRN
jgi:RNA polymerase sigma-70 factor (ECF subfamily)